MTQQQPSPPPEGSIYQSCTLPLAAAEDFGTEAGGSPSADYCRHCYQNGAFTSDTSMQEMIEMSSRQMSEAMGTPEEQAREMLAGILPTLKRWRAA